MNIGGVAIIVLKNIQHELLPDFNTIKLVECIGVNIYTVISEFKFISTYFPGDNAYGNNHTSTILNGFKHDIQTLCNIGG